jgi:hypothetical protein
MWAGHEASHSSSHNDEDKNSSRCTLIQAFVCIEKCLIKQKTILGIYFYFIPVSREGVVLY